MDYAEYQERISKMTHEQKRLVRDKCQWEGCSWRAVARDWPSMFDVDGMPPATATDPASAEVEPWEEVTAELRALGIDPASGERIE